jgi:hypothetical protein
MPGNPLAGITAAGDQLAAVATDHARLTAALQGAESALFARLAAAFKRGQVSLADLAELFAGVRESLSPGWTQRWDAALPGTRGRVQALISEAQRGQPHSPNAAAGSWRGPWPLGKQAARPRRGVNVVYVLYGGGQVVYPCETRDLAYRVEDRLLKRRLPPGNLRRWA